MPNTDLMEVEDMDRQECLMNSDYGITKKQLMMCFKDQ